MGIGEDLSDGSDSTSSYNSSAASWMTESDFQREFRVNRQSFHAIHNLIKGHNVFVPKLFGPQQIDSRLQLLIFLRYLGMNGNGNSNQRMRLFFPCSAGSIQVAKDRVLLAILSLRDIAIKWPDCEERAKIEKRFRQNYDFPNLVFIADGTLFPLACRRCQWSNSYNDLKVYWQAATKNKAHED